jgi:hypothetical protein
LCLGEQTDAFFVFLPSPQSTSLLYEFEQPRLPLPPRLFFQELLLQFGQLRIGGVGLLHLQQQVLSFLQQSLDQAVSQKLQPFTHCLGAFDLALHFAL